MSFYFIKFSLLFGVLFFFAAIVFASPKKADEDDSERVVAHRLEPEPKAPVGKGPVGKIQTPAPTARLSRKAPEAGEDRVGEVGGSGPEPVLAGTGKAPVGRVRDPGLGGRPFKRASDLKKGDMPIEEEASAAKKSKNQKSNKMESDDKITGGVIGSSPSYMKINGWDSCVVTKKVGKGISRCMPHRKRDGCNQRAWRKLKKSKDKPEAC